MSEGQRDDATLLRSTSTDDQQQRHHQAILQTNPSIISFESVNLPRNIIDVFDEVYSNQAHRQCIDRSYFTLLSLTLAVIFWIAHWLTYNRCENIKEPQSNTYLCNVVIFFEVLTFILVGISPFLFLLTIYSWIHYSCYNPFDKIRNKFVGFKLEGDQWKQQLDYYYNKRKFSFCNCFRNKQRKELNDRGYGYIILSPYGIVIDELIFLGSRRNKISDGILLDNDKILKLSFKKILTRPWKTSILIYLSDDLYNQPIMEELTKLLKIQININSILPVHY